MGTKHILVAAASLLSGNGAWTQDTHARRSDDSSCSPIDKEATCWCTVGAILKINNAWPPVQQVWELPAIIALTNELVARKSGHGRVTMWNDDANRTQAQVLQLFDAAIATMERENGEA